MSKSESRISVIWVSETASTDVHDDDKVTDDAAG